MKRLLVATRNRGKQAELREMLKPLPFEIVFPDDIGLAEQPEEAGIERFTTFEENARAKAQWFANLSGLATLADDAGIEVDALSGAPGVYSRRFAGIDGPDHEVADANNAELLRRLSDVPLERRTARYRGVLFPGGRHAGVSGRRGVYRADSPPNPVAPMGSGTIPLFLSDDLGVTFGEATSEAKDAVSHRGRAVAALRRALGQGTSLD